MFAQLIAQTAMCVFSQMLTEKMHQEPLIGLTASIYITPPLFACRIRESACKSDRDARVTQITYHTEARDD